jgi:hypothetical protein
MTTNLIVGTGGAVRSEVVSATPHRRQRARRAAALLAGIVMTALLTGVSPTAANAEGDSRKPLLREKIDERFAEEIEPSVLELCGVELRIDGHIWGQFVLYGDMTARQHLNIDFTWSTPSTGEIVLIERDAETFFQVPISETIDEQAGTVTLVYETKITGLPIKGRVPGEGVLIRDAGWVTEVATVVLDLDTGEQLSVEAEFTDIRGPHPFAELTPAERDALFCSAVAG